MAYPVSISLRPNAPDFLNLPWDLPFVQWKSNCDFLEDAPSGLSRHPVWFVNYHGSLFALKELPASLAEKEYNFLRQMEDWHLPVVTPIGFACTETSQGPASVLVTQYLDRSLPYRMLFMQSGLERYREHLLDAVAGLLVQLHLAGVYWGDCSLSNTLFRRDAGALRAYLVDAETTELYPEYFPPMHRLHDLDIMEENINGDLADLDAAGLLSVIDPQVPIWDSGAYIRLRYQRLWEEITSEAVINPGEHYRIQERIRALNALGFSVGDVALESLENGSQLRLRVMVTDRNFHHDQLYGLTGLDVEEKQAQKMMNEIQELKATLSRQNNRSMPLSVVAYHWLQEVYAPVVRQIEKLLADRSATAAELYCQVLENKWYLSEQARQDVGHQMATEDYLQRFGNLAKEREMG